MPRYRTITQAAEQEKVSRRTLEYWIKAGHIRAFRVPGDRRTWVDVDEIRAYRKPRPRDEQPPPVGGGSADFTSLPRSEVGDGQPRCPGCGAHSLPGAARCWRCGRALGTA